MAEDLTFSGGHVIVGAGGVVLEQATVVVRDGRIASVSKSAAPPSAEVIDLEGKTLLPGLIDAHVHLTSLGEVPDERRREQLDVSMRQLLGAGITTVRDLGAYGTYLQEIREEASRAACRAPRLVLCGQVISAPCPGARAFPGMYREASGPSELRAAVAEQAERGADVIKVMSTGALTVADEDVNPAQLSGDDLSVLVDSAHRLGLPVASHAEGAEGVRLSVEAGADTIEHGEMGHEVPESLSAMAERGIILVPTLSVFDHVAESDRYPGWMRDRARRLGEAARITVEMAKRCGVSIGMGADAPPPGGNAAELLRLCDAGLGALESIEAATGVAARACRVDPFVGTVMPGKLADLVVVDGDPLSDPALLVDPARISLVFQAGELVARKGSLAV